MGLSMSGEDMCYRFKVHCLLFHEGLQVKNGSGLSKPENLRVTRAASMPLDRYNRIDNFRRHFGFNLLYYWCLMLGRDPG